MTPMKYRKIAIEKALANSRTYPPHSLEMFELVSDGVRHAGGGGIPPLRGRVIR